MGDTLRTLINQSNKENTTATTTTFTTSAQDYRLKMPQQTQVKPQYGWQCPICGAVMSPWTTSCINSHSNAWTTWSNYTIQLENPTITCQAKTNI